MDPQGLADMPSPRPFLEFLRLWEGRFSSLDEDWACERKKLEVEILRAEVSKENSVRLKSELSSNKNSLPDNEASLSEVKRQFYHSRTKSEIPLNSKLFNLYARYLSKKHASNCNSLLEEDEEHSQLKSEDSKRAFELQPELEDGKSSKNIRFPDGDCEIDARRFSSDQKNHRQKPSSRNKFSFKGNLNKADFINEKSEECSQDSRRAEFNFNLNEAKSRADCLRRKNIKNHLASGLEHPQPRPGIRGGGEPSPQRKALAPPPDLSSTFILSDHTHRAEGEIFPETNLASNKISKNPNTISYDSQSFIFDEKTGSIIQPAEPPVRHLNDISAIIGSGKRLPQSSFELESSKQIPLANPVSKEKVMTADKKAPFTQKLSDIKKFPSLVLDPRLHVKDKRPYTLECIDVTNKTENETNSHILSITHDNSASHIRHLLNVNADIFDSTFVQNWLPAKKTPHSTPFELLSGTPRPNLKILQSRNAHLDSVRKLEFLSEGPNQTFLATISDDCLVKLWNFKYKETAAVEEPSRQSNLLMPSSILARMPKPGSRGDICPPRVELSDRTSHKSNLFDRVSSPKLYSSASMDLHQVVRAHQAPLFSCCKSYSDNLPYAIKQGPIQLFTGDLKGTISCLRLVNGRLLHWKTFKSGLEPVWALSYAHPGFLLSSTPNKIKLFDLSKLKNKTEEFSISTNKRFFAHLEFMTPESFIVNSFSSKTTKNEFLMFDLMKEKESGRMVSKQGLSNYFKSISKFDMLISANEDRSISLYDIREKEQMRSIVAHSNTVVSFDVNMDRHLLATAGCDSSIRMWDMRTLRCLSELSVHRMKHDDSIFDVKFDPRADFLCTAGADSSVKVFQF